MIDKSPSSLSRRAVLGGIGTAFVLPRRTLAAADERAVLQARPGSAKLLGADGPETAIWGYGGGAPGPVLRVRQGERVRVLLMNGLAQSTTVHWHGIRIANAMDGVPHLTQRAVEAGQTFDYDFAVPDAGTFWYHPHQRSYEQVARGLFGALIVEERQPPQVDQDLVLVINDWRLGGDGAFSDKTLGSAHDRAHAGRLGNRITVNGATLPVLPTRTNERLRLRLINASSARVLKLVLEGAAATLIATDGQPVGPTPAETYADGLTLGPGNRADVIVDVIGRLGEAITLTDVFAKRQELARLVIAGGAARAALLATPIVLAPNPVAEPAATATTTIDIVMTGGAKNEMDMSFNDTSKPAWFLNGVAGMGAAPLFAAGRGETVAIRLVNDTAWAHSMHVHGHHFRLAARSSGKRIDPFWLDTVLVEKGETVTIAFAADNPGKWMIHCHMLDHQAAGMDTWFSVG